MEQILSQLNQKILTTEAQRRQLLQQMREDLDAQKMQLTHFIVSDVKKTQDEAQLEVEKSITAIDYVLQCDWQKAIKQFLNLPPQFECEFAPYGTILAIMPWNFPMWQLFRMLPWNLLIGNSVLHKNSVYTPSITKAVTQIVQKFFPNQFYSFYLPDEEVEELIAHPLIHGVTLTGSTRAGRRVAAQAGAHLKKCVLELGGSDAFLVAPQAEVTKVVTQGIASRLINWGQSCIAAKRFIVHQRIFNDFVESLKKNLSTIASRNFVSVEAEERLRKQLHRALAEGAKVLWPVGEERWPAILISRGVEPFFFEEEFFGPVFILVSYDTLDEAITIANRNQFGLGASAWGYSLEEQNELQKRLEVSLLFFDDVVRSRPDVPFAGTKNSGWGWEMGILGFLEFTHLRIIKKSS